MSTISIPTRDGPAVSGLVDPAEDPVAWYVLAHGAGAGMRHPLVAEVARELAARGISVLRYQFPYMDAGSRRPDSPAVAHRTVRAAVETGAGLADGLPLFAGGRSFGGRMTSQAQATEPMPGLRGLALLAYPLHAAGKPSRERAAHLEAVRLPMLFVQGTRDSLAELGLLRGVTSRIPHASLQVVDGADHSFAVPVRSGRSPADVLELVCTVMTTWMVEVSGRRL